MTSLQNIRVLFSLLALSVMTIVANATAPKPTEIGTENSSEELTIQDGDLAGITVDYILNTDYETMNAETGLKLNFIQRWGLKRAQKRYVKLQKKPEKAAKFKERIAQQQSGGNKFGLIALILGVFGILTVWIPIIGILGFFALIAAFVLGIIGIKRDDKPGMAIAGVVLGGLGILIFLIAVLVAAAAIV